MIKTLKKLLVLALTAAASMSCGLAFLSDDEAHLDGNLKIVVNGVVSDVATNAPLTDVEITFSAYAENTLSILPLLSKTVSTNSKGEYTVEAYGFSEPVTCSMTAAGNDEYKQMENKIVVTWSGNSFDERNDTFYVNDCNFQMEKKN